MKTSVLFLAVLFFAPQFSRAEGTRGGGDDIGLEFQGVLNAALDEIKAAGGDLQGQVAGLNLDSLYARDGASALVVEETQKVIVGGVVQDCVATSDPATMLTRITRARWKSLNSVHLKEGIALHEALVLKNREGTGQYPISGKFLARFGIAADSLLSGNPFPNVSLGKVLTVDCTPKKYWRADAAEAVSKVYLVFDGKRGLQDPVMVLTYNQDQGIPSRIDSIEASLDSDTPGKIIYRLGNSTGSLIPAVWLDSVSFDFKALTLGATGNALVMEHMEQIRGVESTPVTHSLSCKITNYPPKG